MVYYTFRKLILFGMLISSCSLLTEEPQEAVDIQADTHVDAVGADSPGAENSHKGPSNSDILEVFSKYDKNLIESGLIDLIVRALERNPELIRLPFCKASFELLRELLENYKVNANEENDWFIPLLEIVNICVHQKDELDKNSTSIDHLGAITCVASFEKNEAMGELLRAASTMVNILELLETFGDTITDQQLDAWIRREIQKNPEIGRCAVDAYGNTLVHITSCREMIPITELLLADYKADVNALNGWGLAPIDMALLCNEQKQALIEKVFNALLDQQEQLKMPDLDGQKEKFELENEMPKFQQDQVNQVNQTTSFSYSQFDTLHDEL